MGKIKKYVENNWKLTLLAILLLNFAIRLLIYSKTVLFEFSDYKVYLDSIDKIHRDGAIPMASGNFLFTISYLGYFTKFLLGSLNYFFILNCFLGTTVTYILAILIIKFSGSIIGGITSAIILTIYTEFMVFSSVFYSPVIMLFLLSLFILLFYRYYKTSSLSRSILNVVLLVVVYLTTFLFKPELIFLPIFLTLLSLFFIKKDEIFFKRTIFLSIALIVGTTLFLFTSIFSKPKDQVIANDFIFFGHTDYGGNGGEGSFIYHENEVRYYKALSEWCEKNKITRPGTKEINRFQRDEIIKFVIHSPFSWIKLQFTKLFRTFGVVPESTSFKILYTGLFKGNLWLTSIIVVAPVAIIILLFILCFNFSSMKKLLNSSTVQPINFPTPHTSHLTPHTDHNKHFLIVYCLLFFYYLIATIFFGQYQERYRMPVMVVFVIPILTYFIASFERKQFFNRISLSIKCAVIVLFMTVWVFQAKKTISNKERLEDAIESVKGVIK